jgi:hypothetical protein
LSGRGTAIRLQAYKIVSGCRLGKFAMADQIKTRPSDVGHGREVAYRDVFPRFIDCFSIARQVGPGQVRDHHNLGAHSAAGLESKLPRTAAIVDRLALLVGPVQPRFAVEVAIYPLDVTLCAVVFPVTRPVWTVPDLVDSRSRAAAESRRRDRLGDTPMLHPGISGSSR